MTDQLVPLALVAALLSQEVGQLAARVREHVVIDPETGLDSVPAAICRQLTDEYRAAKAAQVAQIERMRRELAARQHSLHAGLRARAVRQRALPRNKPGLGAYAVMALDSGGRRMSSTPAADAMMIMSMPKDAAWPDSVIDSHRKVNHHATHRHPRPAATTRRPGTHRRRPRTPGGARRPRDAVRRDPSTPLRRADGRPRRRYPHRRAAAAGAAHRAANWLPGVAVSFGDYELLGDAADIMARQRTRQRW